MQPVNFRKQGAWALWWLTIITLGVYYFVWYHRINKELSWALSREQPSDGTWWSQLIPVYGIIGMHRTAKRLNAVHEYYGSPTRVGPVTFWLWSAAWFASHTRYLQRRINIAHDVLASRAISSTAAAEPPQGSCVTSVCRPGINR